MFFERHRKIEFKKKIRTHENRDHIQVLVDVSFLWLVTKRSQLKFQAASCYQTIHQLAGGKTIGVTPWPQWTGMVGSVCEDEKTREFKVPIVDTKIWLMFFYHGINISDDK